MAPAARGRCGWRRFVADAALTLPRACAGPCEVCARAPCLAWPCFPTPLDGGVLSLRVAPHEQDCAGPHPHDAYEWALLANPQPQRLRELLSVLGLCGYGLSAGSAAERILLAPWWQGSAAVVVAPCNGQPSGLAVQEAARLGLKVAVWVAGPYAADLDGGLVHRVVS